MQNKYGKRLILMALMLLGTSAASAANNPPTQASETTNAIAFASQAGQIAGSAQACGLDIATFTTRVSEAINKLGLNPTDIQAATNTFQSTLQRAEVLQRNNNIQPCSQLKQDFNNLPLLRADYEQSVIAQLSPGMESNTAQSQSNAGANNSAQANGPNQQQNLNNQALPNNNNAAANSNNNQNNPAANNSPYTKPEQGYGPMKPFSNNYSGAIKPLGMNNNNTANAPAPNNNSNNPPPPNFSNPNNTPPQPTNNYSNP